MQQISLARPSAGHAVFVQTDNTSGNEVVAYQRAANGTLSENAAYPTGGLGGILAGIRAELTALYRAWRADADEQADDQ